MENQQNNSNLKVVVAILGVLLLGSLGYIFKMTSDLKTVETTLTTTTTEKDAVMKDLKDLKATYDTAIAENTSMSDELIKERDKVVQLMEELKASKGDVASLSKYKKQFIALQANMKVLMAENEGLKKQNVTLTTQRDSTITVLGEAKKVNENLTAQNQNLASTVEKGSKLTILNTKGQALKIKSSGKVIETDKASRANTLRVSFTIAENQIAQAGNKLYYVQVIDSENNVVGEKITENFGEKTLTYSFAKDVNYENKTIDVTQDIKGDKFAKGTYYVNVFDKGTLVSSTTFSLR